MDVSNALARLNGLLPLYERQEQLTPELRKLHQNILVSLANTAKVPGGLNYKDLIVLAEKDLIVLNQEQTEIRGAYPFSLNKTDHRISLENAEIYAMCAFDAIAIAPVFNIKTKIFSSCYVTKENIEIHQDSQSLTKINPSKDIHIGIKWQETGVCAADSLCMEMIFLKDKKIAAQWMLSGDKSIYPINDAIEFSTEFFKPLVS